MKSLNVLNLGAGVQSTCVYLMLCEPAARRYPLVDYAIFADTQEEPAAVYRHLDWLMRQKGPPILVRTAGKLGDQLIHGKDGKGGRFASIPAFTKGPDGRIGMTRRQCTSEAKIAVCNKTIRYELLGLKPRQRVPKDTIVNQFFGISLDEAGRAERAKKRFATQKWTRPVYPLIEMGWSRKDCLAYLKDRVPHEVPKSACVFCPYKSNQAWAEMKAKDPESWARAVEVDNALRADGSICTRSFRQQLFVHRSATPLRDVDFSRVPLNTIDPMATECTGMCGL